MSGSGLSVGIVGLPNVGKSTLFNALLKKQAALAANYPFATIEPNVGIVPVPDARLEKLQEVVTVCEKCSTPPLVPATVKFVDIAGLVKGASQGAGLGNKFLANIREVDLICQVVRSFPDPEIIREGSVAPLDDIQIINTELALADLQTLEKASEQKATLERKELLARLKVDLNVTGQYLDSILDDDRRALAKELQLFAAKKVIYVINISYEEKNQPEAAKLQESRDCVFIDAKVESELAGFSPDEQSEYLKSYGLSEPGLNRLIKEAYKALGLISFLTAGEKEVRAWTIKNGATAPEAAGVIHTDFEKNFIKAEVISFDDYISYGGVAKCKEAGKMRLEGREYVMNDGDVVEFKVGV